MKGRTLRTIGIALCLTVLCSTNAFAEWKQEGINWRFVNADGSYASEGWRWIDGKCYYFTPEGYCLINTKTPDGYDVDGSGAWVINGVIQTQHQTQALEKGWRLIDGGWRYYTGSKYLTSSWITLEQKSYYLDESGNMVTGFQDIGGDRYFFNSDGSVQTESFSMDGMRYIVGKKGVITDEVNEFDWYSGSYQDYDYSDSRGSSGGSSYTGYSQSQNVDEDSYAYAVFGIVNRERSKNGQSELVWDEGLAYCAQERAYEIVEKFSHTRPDGSSCSTILAEEGISYMSSGENIAYGQRSPEEVMTGWMNSSGHKANILRSGFGRIGVGCAYVNGTLYWVQMFTD